MDLDQDLAVGAGPSEAEGRAAVRELARRGHAFDAVFASSDLAALGAMHELQDMGRRVPEDVSIVGFDDIGAARLATPPLTTVAQDAKLGGAALVECLLEMIETGGCRSRLLPVKLVVRGSSLV